MSGTTKKKKSEKARTQLAPRKILIVDKTCLAQALILDKNLQSRSKHLSDSLSDIWHSFPEDRKNYQPKETVVQEIDKEAEKQRELEEKELEEDEREEEERIKRMKEEKEGEDDEEEGDEEEGDEEEGDEEAEEADEQEDREEAEETERFLQSGRKLR